MSEGSRSHLCYLDSVLTESYSKCIENFLSAFDLDRTKTRVRMSPYQSYSSALRCIGQALETRDVVAFELRYENDEFRLQCGGSSPYTELIDLSFSEQEISGLERQGHAKRRGSSNTLDFDGLPEMLRAVGRFIDSKRGHLVRICNVNSSSPADDSFDLEYKDYNGQTRVEKLFKASLHDRLVRMYKERC